MSEADTNGEEEFVALTREYVRSKIRHVLLIYPHISMSMLQVGIGTGIPPKFWHSVFNQMVEEGQVVISTRSCSTPSGRDQTYKIVSLVIPPEM